MQKTLYIKAGILLTMDPKSTVYENTVIEISDGKIKNISPKIKPKPKSKIVDASDCIVMPGLINGHVHMPMQIFRGIAEDLKLFDWLYKKILPLEQKFVSSKFVYEGSLLACAELIRFGVTTFNDMYYFEDQIARAAHETGLRSICSPTIIEHENMKTSVKDEMEEFLSKVKKYPLATPGIAPHAIYDVSEKTLREVVDYAKKYSLKVHVHLCETQQEVEQCQKKFGKSPTKCLEDLGLFENHVICAHSVCLTEEDRRIIMRHSGGIVHNPASNMKLGTTIAKISEMVKEGMNVALGTDSVASNNNFDLFQTASLANKLQSYQKGPGHFTAHETVRSLTIQGAKALGLDSDVGSIEVGKSADVIAVSLKNPHMIPLYDPYTQLVHSANGSDVKHSIVNGKILMENFDLKTIDFKEMQKIANTWKKKITEA
jgi:5-methylthioadenosine/S-adenosylhomocysteine deaminase